MYISEAVDYTRNNQQIAAIKVSLSGRILCVNIYLSSEIWMTRNEYPVK